jgi:inosine/xanthosine triphosphatase
MQVLVASTNPVKIECVRLGFADMFPGQPLDVTGYSVPSGVSQQPLSDRETLEGACNRVAKLQLSGQADYYVGIEGGVEEKSGQMEAFAWIVVVNKSGRLSRSRTGTFVIPPAVSLLIAQGKELGEADDIVFKKTDSKKKTGAVGILTHNVIDRTAYYRQAVALALIPFRNPTLYP